MFNMVKAELYKNTRRPFLYVLTAVCGGVIALLNSTFYFNQTLRETAMPSMLSQSYVGLFFIVLFADAVLAEELRLGTLKNTVSFGAARGTVYGGRLIAASILYTAYFVGISVVFWASGCLFMPAGPGFNGPFIANFLLRTAATLATRLSALSLALFLALLLKRNATLIFAFLGAMLLPAGLLLYLSPQGQIFSQLLSMTLIVQSTMVGRTAIGNMGVILLTSAVRFAVFAAAGMLVFHRQEVN
ncbi:hypothetical protein SDC9_117627 [bioreactor metagenome]|uniref:ABC-2 family transporter protein n=1 Tax=bioreactor metagenome TaxID=1076179 RepID=A0A645C170_9ZZZZ